VLGLHVLSLIRHQLLTALDMRKLSAQSLSVIHYVQLSFLSSAGREMSSSLWAAGVISEIVKRIWSRVWLM